MIKRYIGKLYIVPTPIGNLEDITIRAINTLKNVDLIASENTKHTKILLKVFNINTSIISLHNHNENKQTKQIIIMLKKKILL
ncbi:SAM-dependent methyltransferase [Buchnera aphidicola]|uniref:SAM-dependent methyltransferase n=1 Tax=Buchnera aphidicola TaxID=9 RepID=UPI003967B067